ncbi:MAG TPA: helix-turn-helix transcriptional regulator [Candidatus Angelobacter sp.]|nr:helix-turn-helix transcriptional regulator [Candidatus Angelobacter sp.]
MTMTKTLEQMMKEVSPARRKKIERRAAQLIAEEMSLRELRRAHKLTQERLAETLKIGQDQVSRLEQRSDLLISTLRSYIEAMGGTLTLLAEFPHRKPVVVAGLSTLGPDSSESSPMAPSRVSAKQKRVAFGMTFERTETGRSRTSRQALAVRS